MYTKNLTKNSNDFQSNEVKNKMKFIDLNVDCLLLILERLDFAELLNVAEINDEFSTLAADVFRRQYSQFQIVIREVFPLPDNSTELLNVAGMEIDMETIDRVNKDLWRHVKEPPIVSKFENSNQIELKTGDQILNTFKHFGHAIKRFRSNVCLGNGRCQTELIGRLINKYGVESLTDLFIVKIAETFLKHIEKPLINVNSLSFQGNDNSVDCRNIRLKELFPAVLVFLDRR